MTFLRSESSVTKSVMRFKSLKVMLLEQVSIPMYVWDKAVTFSAATEFKEINNKAVAGQQKLRNPGGLVDQTHPKRCHRQPE